MLVLALLSLCPVLGILLVIFLIQSLWGKVVWRNQFLLGFLILQILKTSMPLILYPLLLCLGIQYIFLRRLDFFLFGCFICYCSLLIYFLYSMFYDDFFTFSECWFSEEVWSTKFYYKYFIWFCIFLNDVFVFVIFYDFFSFL